MRTRASLAAVAAVAILAGCADGPEEGRTGANPPTGPPRPPEVLSVRLVISGGITGAREVVRVVRGDPPAGLSAAETDRVLALAGAKAVRSLPSGRLPRAAACCDRRLLDLTVRYADGTTARVRTSEAHTARPPELRRLVALMSARR